MFKGLTTQTSVPVHIGDGDTREVSLRLASIKSVPCTEEISGHRSKATQRKLIPQNQCSFKGQAL